MPSLPSGSARRADADPAGAPVHLKQFAGTNGFQQWTSSVEYFAEQFDQQATSEKFF